MWHLAHQGCPIEGSSTACPVCCRGGSCAARWRACSPVRVHSCHGMTSKVVSFHDSYSIYGCHRPQWSDCCSNCLGKIWINSSLSNWQGDQLCGIDIIIRVKLFFFLSKIWVPLRPIACIRCFYLELIPIKWNTYCEFKVNMWYFDAFQPSKCSNTLDQPQISPVWPIFPKYSESLLFKLKNSENLSSLGALAVASKIHFTFFRLLISVPQIQYTNLNS